MVRVFKKNNQTFYDISEEAKETLDFIKQLEDQEKEKELRFQELKSRLKKLEAN